MNKMTKLKGLHAIQEYMEMGSEKLFDWRQRFRFPMWVEQAGETRYWASNKEPIGKWLREHKVTLGTVTEEKLIKAERSWRKQASLPNSNTKEAHNG